MDWKTSYTIWGLIVGVAVGTVGHETRYAKVQRLQLVEMRLEQKIIMDRYWWLKERLGKIHQEFPDKRVMPVSVRGECQALDREITDIEMKMKVKEK